MRDMNRGDTISMSRAYQVLLILVLIVLVISVWFDSSLETEPLSDGQQLLLDSGWTLSVGDLILASEISLPFRIEDPVETERYRMSRKLPSEFPNTNASLFLETSMSSVEVLLDGEAIYSFSADTSLWKVPVPGGSFAHFIRLPDWAPGHELTLVFEFSSDNVFAGRVYAPVIGTKTDQLISRLRELPSIAFGLIFLFTGLVCVLTSLGLHRGKGQSSLWSFGWLEIAIGAWVFTQNSAKLIIIRNPAVPMNFSFAALFLLPFLLLQYVRFSYDLDQRKLKVFQLLSSGFLIAFIAGGAAQYFGLFEYTDMLVPSGMALALFILSLFSLLLVEYLRGNRGLFSFLLAVGVLFTTVAAEEILMMMSVVLENAVILHAGMSLCAAILLTHSARIISSGERDEIREQMLLELAYTDPLTGLNNRTSYERWTAPVNEREHRASMMGVLLFDVNDLKTLNDRFGHKAGDELLKDVARRIPEMLPARAEVFRIGGDEFVSFIPEIPERELSGLCYEIRTQRFLLNGFRYSVACGYSIFKSENPLSFAEIIAEADRAMYICKAYMKERASRDQPADVR